MGFEFAGLAAIIVLLFSVAGECIEKGKEIKNKNKLIKSRFNSKGGFDENKI